MKGSIKTGLPKPRAWWRRINIFFVVFVCAMLTCLTWLVHTVRKEKAEVALLEVYDKQLGAELAPYFWPSEAVFKELEPQAEKAWTTEALLALPSLQKESQDYEATLQRHSDDKELVAYFVQAQREAWSTVLMSWLDARKQDQDMAQRMVDLANQGGINVDNIYLSNDGESYLLRAEFSLKSNNQEHGSVFMQAFGIVQRQGKNWNLTGLDSPTPRVLMELGGA